MNELLFKALKRRRISEVRSVLETARTQLTDRDYFHARTWFPVAIDDMNKYCLAWPKRPASMNDLSANQVDIMQRALARARAPAPNVPGRLSAAV